MKYQIGQIVDGVVNGIQEYGVFVKLDNKVEGLLHMSEIVKANPNEKYKLGEPIKVMVLDIDPFSNQISLSQRSVMKNKIDIRKNKRHFWTSKSVNIGFKPLEIALSKEIEVASKKYKKYLA